MTSVPPWWAIRVSYNPIRDTILDTPSDSCDCMIWLISAYPIENVPLKVYHSLCCLNRHWNWPCRKSGVHIWNTGESRDLCSYVSWIEFANSFCLNVGIWSSTHGSTSRYKVIIGMIHVASITTWVVGRAINNLLFRKEYLWTLIDCIATFNGCDWSESIAGSAWTLISYWVHHTRPINSWWLL